MGEKRSSQLFGGTLFFEKYISSETNLSMRDATSLEPLLDGLAE